jgi:hypothetical protein
MDGEFQSNTKKKVPVHIAKRTFIIDSESLSEEDTPNAEESLEEDSDFVEERPSRPTSQRKRSLSRSNEKKTQVSIEIRGEEEIVEEELKGEDTWIDTEDIQLHVKKRQKTERKILSRADVHRHSKKDSPESLPSSIEAEADGSFAKYQRFIIYVEEDEEQPYEEANEEANDEVNEANGVNYEVNDGVNDEINDEANNKLSDEVNEVNDEANEEMNEVNEVDYVDEDNPNAENEYETKYEAWYEGEDHGGTDEYEEVQHTEPAEETGEAEYEEWPETDEVQNSPPVDPDEARKYKQENEVLRERIEFLEEQNSLLAEENSLLKKELRILQQTNQSHEEQGVEVDFTVEEPQGSKEPDQINTSPRPKKTWVFPSEVKTAEAKRSLFK